MGTLLLLAGLYLREKDLFRLNDLRSGILSSADEPPLLATSCANIPDPMLLFPAGFPDEILSPLSFRLLRRLLRLLRLHTIKAIKPITTAPPAPPATTIMGKPPPLLVTAVGVLVARAHNGGEVEGKKQLNVEKHSSNVRQLGLSLEDVITF